jgi:hypothetical protein
MAPEPPYGLIVNQLKLGKVVPFLGAGVNMSGRPPNVTWSANGSFLPSGGELAHFLAAEAEYPSDDRHELTDLAKVASYFVDAGGRSTLVERLNGLFQREFEPCNIHGYLAQQTDVHLFVTTNFDDLLERAFQRANRPYDLVIHPTDRADYQAAVLWWEHGAGEPKPIAPNLLQIDLSKTTVIYKMHGTVARALRDAASYVITEDDYVEFLARMTNQTAVPACFMLYFRARHFLFLGYGLRDWNWRVVLRNLRGAFSAGRNDDDDTRSWAIQHNPSPAEVNLWTMRRVKIYDKDINEFVAKLQGIA